MQMKFKSKAQRMVAGLAFLTMLFSLLWAADPGMAGATNTVGEKTSTLTIKVNDNGTVTTAGAFTVSDMQKMSQTRSIYSSVNNNSTSKFYVTEGVLLTDLLARANIDLTNVDKLRFVATDKYTQTFDREYLLDTPRYYYPGGEAAIPVEPILSLKSREQKDNSLIEYERMDDYYSVRLFFGQNENDKITDKGYVKWVEHIEVFTIPTSARPPALTADTVNNNIGQAVNLTFTDDKTWRDAITDVSVDGLSVSGKYTVAAGVITIDAGVFDCDKDYAIIVKANGYLDTAANQHKGPWPAIFTVDGNAVTACSYTMADLRLMPSATERYGPDTCRGVMLKDLLAPFNINNDSCQVQINVIDADTFRIDPVKVSDMLDPANKYLLTYDINEQPISIGPTNQTTLRIYWSTGIVYKHVTGITVTNYKEWPLSKETPVDSKRKWTIKFSQPVLNTQVLKDHIFVTDSTGAKQEVTVRLIETDPKTIEVAPQNGYPAGDYTLWIKGSLQSATGKLKQPVKLNFRVAEY